MHTQAERPALQASAAAQIPAPAAPTGLVVDPGWQASVFGWLASRKSYPEEARRRGEEGRVAVRFTVDRSGRVVDAAIVSASGSTLLDEATLTLLRQAVLPPFPVDMTQARITITTTMRYSLR
jgi:protein TonB